MKTFNASKTSLPSYKRLMKFLNRSIQPPREIQFALTNLCNANCIFCVSAIKNGNSKNIPPHRRDRIHNKRFLSMIKEGCSFKPNTITLTGGGEPLLKKKLFLAAAKEIKKHNIRGRLVTNGALFDEEVVRKLIEIKWDFVSLSVNAYTQELDDFLRGKKGLHILVLNGLKLFNEWKNKLESKLPILDFHMVITKYNFKEVCNIIRMANQWNVSEISIHLVDEPDKEAGHFSVSHKNYNELIREVKKAEKLAKSKGIIFHKHFSEQNFEKRLNLEENVKSLHLRKEVDETFLLKAFNKYSSETIFKCVFCTVPFNELFVHANGYASCCGCFASMGKGPFNESVLDKSLRNVWYGEKFNNLRALMLLHHSPARCQTCNRRLQKGYS